MGGHHSRRLRRDIQVNNQVVQKLSLQNIHIRFARGVTIHRSGSPKSYYPRFQQSSSVITMNRRNFIIKAGKAFPVIAGAVYIVGCDSNDSNDSGSGNNNGNNGGQPTTLRVFSTTSAGHSHSADLPLADVDSVSSKSYQSSNSGGHIHSVTLSVAQLTTIGGGGIVTVTSTDSGGHTHGFTFELTA